jgi:hypothetical protein
MGIDWFPVSGDYDNGTSTTSLLLMCGNVVSQANHRNIKATTRINHNDTGLQMNQTTDKANASGALPVLNRAYYRTVELANGRRGTARLYNVWANVRKRCYSIWRADYSYYGGRGITVCDEWRDSYDAFRAWSIANGFRKGLWIDREDHNGNYEPGNCRWITRSEQMRNTSRSPRRYVPQMIIPHGGPNG